VRDKQAILPPSLPPRGLSREQAAAYCGIGTSLFDNLVESGVFPTPKALGARRVWDRLELDKAFSAVPNIRKDIEDVWSKVEL